MNGGKVFVVVVILSALFLTGCSNSSSGGASTTYIPSQLDFKTAYDNEKDLRTELERNQTIHLAYIQLLETDLTLLKRDALLVYEENKGAWQLKNYLEQNILFNKNPTGTRSNDYAYCGDKFEGDKTGCIANVACTGSMKPLFNCQEKLYFTRSKISYLQPNDVVDVKLPTPLTQIDEDGKLVVIKSVIHIVRKVDGSTLYTGRLNPGTEGYYTGNTLYDDLTFNRQDLQGVLKEVEW